MGLRNSLTALAIAALLPAASQFRVPGINYTAQVRDEVSILPGGRVLRPFGRQVPTETAPFAIAVSPSGKTIVTANIGISMAIGVAHPSITVIVPGKHDAPWNLTDIPAESRQPHPLSHTPPWSGLTTGLAIVSDSSAWVSEGDSGRVVELNLSTGSRKSTVTIDSAFTDALLYDPGRSLLIVLDQASSRAVLIDIRRLPAVLSSVKTGVRPVALALSPDGKLLYVATSAPSLSLIDLSDPSAPKPRAEIPLPGTPSGIAAVGDEVFVSLEHTDSVAVVLGPAAKLDGEIPLRIPGLESYRGITPLGLAFEPKSRRLLVAEAGINAVGVIDPAARRLLGHLPVGWFPDSIAVHDGQVFVASARGFGTGPSVPAHHIRMFGAGKPLTFETDTSVLRRGSVSSFAVPADADLATPTGAVFEANGFLPDAKLPPPRPVPPVRYVVLIQKGDRSFDEILGDVSQAGDRRVFGEPTYARFGLDAYVSGNRKRFSLRVDVTPNHHELAARWSFADNYYVDSDFPAAVDRWLQGICPGLFSETSLLYQEAGNHRPELQPAAPPSTLWTHLTRHNIPFRTFGRDLPPDSPLSDEQRATGFIDTLTRDYVASGQPLPRFLLLNLPGDTAGPPRPADGYPYQASYVAANDYALGRVVEFLSHTPWWKEMAIFVVQTGADGGADHVDSHRTVLLAAGPWFRNDYVSHTNSSAPALLRTIFTLLHLPPLNLYDATAADLSDAFGIVPDFAPYDVKTEDSRLLDPPPSTHSVEPRRDPAAQP